MGNGSILNLRSVLAAMGFCLKLESVNIARILRLLEREESNGNSVQNAQAAMKS